MKIRLFCFLSAMFLLAGLLMPVGVYAEDVPGVDATLTIETNADGDTAASCEGGEPSTTVTTAETVTVEDDGTSTEEEPTEGDATGATNPCGDDDGGFSRVSWNS